MVWSMLKTNLLMNNLIRKNKKKDNPQEKGKGMCYKVTLRGGGQCKVLAKPRPMLGFQEG